MLERLKTTGHNTRLASLDTAWNTGCGGDTNSNILHRLSCEQGLYTILKTAQEQEDQEQEQEKKMCDIKHWLLAFGTNNLHPKRGLRSSDVASWKLLVETGLKIAPRSKVLACDMFYRKDVADELVDVGNEILEKVVREVNEEMRESKGMQEKENGDGDGDEEGNWEEKVKWVEARHLIGKEMLDDHVHLNVEGYEAWDRVLWPYVAEALEK